MKKVIELPIKIAPYQNLNNEKLSKILLKYLKNNKCCINYPNCSHPKHQSNPFLFNLKNKEINILKNNYFNFLKLNFGNFKIIENKSWIFLTNKNETISSVWHNHQDNRFLNFKQISGICYITSTSIGTLFKNEYFKIEIIPHLNHWYIFNSNLNHSPKNEINLEQRIVIATSTIIKQIPNLN